MAQEPWCFRVTAVNQKKLMPLIKRYRKYFKKILKMFKRNMRFFRDAASIYLSKKFKALGKSKVSLSKSMKQCSVKTEALYKYYCFKLSLSNIKFKLSRQSIKYALSQHKKSFLYQLAHSYQKKIFKKFIHNSYKFVQMDMNHYDKKTRRSIAKCKRSLFYKNFKYSLRRFIKKHTTPNIY